MGTYGSSGVLAGVAATAGPLAVCGALVPVREHIANTNAALILVVVIVAVAALGHRLAGMLAALVAAAGFDFFLTHPYERFTIDRTADITTAVLLLLVGLAVSQLAARARRLKVITITDADHLARIHHSARLAHAPTSPSTVVDHTRTQLTDLLGLRGCRFEYGNLMGRPPQLRDDGVIVRDREPWDVDTHGMPGEDVELRVFSHGRYCGRFMLAPEPGSHPSLQARLVAVTLADQAGAALDSATPILSRG